MIKRLKINIKNLIKITKIRYLLKIITKIIKIYFQKPYFKQIFKTNDREFYKKLFKSSQHLR